MTRHETFVLDRLDHRIILAGHAEAGGDEALAARGGTCLLGTGPPDADHLVTRETDLAAALIAVGFMTPSHGE